MNKKLIAISIIGIFIIMGMSSASAVQLKTNHGNQISEGKLTGDGTGYLQVSVRDVFFIPFNPPEGWAVEVRKGSPQGEIMEPFYYEKGSAVYQGLPFDMYYITASAKNCRDKTAQENVYKEYIPGDYTTVHSVIIRFGIWDRPRTVEPVTNPFLNNLLQFFQNIILI